MEGLHYDDRLKCLKLMRLETRRVRSDLIETFKIVNSESFLKTTKVEEEDIQRNYLKRTRLDVKKFSFSNRVVDKWNSLTDSDTCVNCITVNNFKDYILKELYRKPVLLSIIMFESRCYRRTKAFAY